VKPVLVVATRNEGKVRELRRILGCDLEIHLRSLADYPAIPEAAEDAETFEGNAQIKALAAARALREAACADDSGLTVPALGGAPGVHSARYAGEEASDEDNNALLLRRLSNLDPKERVGYFVCAASLAIPESTARDRWGIEPPQDWDTTEDCIRMWTTRAEVPGVLLDAPRGSKGFGYDPLFYHEATGQTFAEMSVEQKNRVSHRGYAFAAIGAQLRHLLINRPLD